MNTTTTNGAETMTAAQAIAIRISYHSSLNEQGRMGRLQDMRARTAAAEQNDTDAAGVAQALGMTVLNETLGSAVEEQVVAI